MSYSVLSGNPERTYLDQLPSELMVDILSYLSSQDLLSIGDIVMLKNMTWFKLFCVRLNIDKIKFRYIDPKYWSLVIQETDWRTVYLELLKLQDFCNTKNCFFDGKLVAGNIYLSTRPIAISTELNYILMLISTPEDFNFEYLWIFSLKKDYATKTIDESGWVSNRLEELKSYYKLILQQDRLSLENLTPEETGILFLIFISYFYSFDSELPCTTAIPFVKVSTMFAVYEYDIVNVKMCYFRRYRWTDSQKKEVVDFIDKAGPEYDALKKIIDHGLLLENWK